MKNLKNKTKIRCQTKVQGFLLNRYVALQFTQNFNYNGTYEENLVPIKEYHSFVIQWANIKSDLASFFYHPLPVLNRFAYLFLFFFYLLLRKEFDASMTLIIGAIAHDATTEATHSGEPNPVTLNITVANVADRVAIMYASSLNGSITITFDSNATSDVFTEVGNLQNTYYTAPGTGAKSAAFSGGTIKTCAVSIYNGVDQTDPIGATNTEDGTASPNGMDLTTTQDNSLRIDSVGLQRDDASDCTGSLDAGTLRVDPQVPQNQFRERVFAYENAVATAGATTRTWTVSAFQRWYGVFELKQSGGGGGATPAVMDIVGGDINGIPFER